MKLTNKLIIITMVLILFSPLVTAETGCFIYRDSGLYCQEVTPTTAKEECSFFTDCQLNHHFYSEESCSSLPICKKVFCKSSCDYEYFGKCYAGEVPEGKESKWCSAGCCRFIYSTSFHCGYKENKWLCEIEAVNKDVNKFSFQSQLDKNSCAQFCFSQDSRKKFLAENVELDSAQAPQNKGLTSKPKNQEMLSDLGTLMSSGNQGNSGEEGTISPWILLGLILLGLIIYWIRKKGLDQTIFKRRKMLKVPKSSVKHVKHAKKKKIFLNELRFHPQVQERIRRLKEHHQEHLKEQKKKDFLTVFGGLPVKETKEGFKKLKLVVREHKKKKLGAITKGVSIKVPRDSREERRKEAETEKKKRGEEAKVSALSKLKKLVEQK